MNPIIRRSAGVKSRRGRAFAGGLIVTCLILGATQLGCQEDRAEGLSAGEGAEPPPTPVETAQAVTRSLRDYRDFTGRTAAANAVDLRARVSGYLLQSPRADSSKSRRSPAESQSPLANRLPDGPAVKVKEGDAVSQGTLLFQIDPVPYQLALDQAEGDLMAAQARLKRAEQDMQRADDLLKQNAVSQAEYDQAVANRAEIVGQIEMLRATVERAELDLDYTRVVSPIDGLLGRTLVTSGNLITADSTLLTTVVATEPIYVYFEVDEHSLLDYRQRIRQGTVQSARQTRIDIEMGLANEEGFPHQGYIDFVDNTTDADTGNTRIRGTFANQDAALSPGLFARIRVPFTAEYEGVMVPTKALAMDQQGRYVMVVINGQVARRGVVAGEIHGDLTVIEEGLESGETVVTSGLQKIGPGSRVQPLGDVADTEQLDEERS